MLSAIFATGFLTARAAVDKRLDHIIEIAVASTENTHRTTLAETWDPCWGADVICQDDRTPEEQIIDIAREHSFDASRLIAIAVCESSMNPTAIGGSHGCFQGLYQWNVCATDVTIAQATDVRTSTQLTIQALERGEDWRWPNCP